MLVNNCLMSSLLAPGSNVLEEKASLCRVRVLAIRRLRSGHRGPFPAGEMQCDGGGGWWW